MLGTSSFQALLLSFSSFRLSGLLFPLHSPSIPVHSSSNHLCWSPVPSSRWNLPCPSLKIHSRCSCHSEFPTPPVPALPESVNLAKLMFLVCLSPLQSTGQVPDQGLLDGYWVSRYSGTTPRTFLHISSQTNSAQPFPWLPSRSLPPPVNIPTLAKPCLVFKAGFRCHAASQETSPSSLCDFY